MRILDFIFPSRCVVCKKQGSYLCTNCFSYLSFDESRKKYKNVLFDECYCGLSYNRTTQKLLYSFKNKPYISDIKDALGELFYESLIQQEGFLKELAKDDWIFTFVPLSKEKFRKRGYNQAEILAGYLAKRFNMRVGKPSDIKNGNVFLVDDFIKTGETLSETAGLLKKNGVKRVIAIILLRE